MANRGEAFYFRPLDQPPTGRACVLSLGIREVMPPGLIRHVGHYADWGHLFMDFHGPALVDPMERAETVERGFILWQPGVIRHYGHPEAPLGALLVERDRIGDRRGACRTCDCAGSGASPRHGRHFLKYLHALYDEVQEHVVADEQIVEGLITLWIREIARAAGTGGARPPPRVIEARRYIESHYAEPLELGALARRAALSVSQFSLVFRAHFGVPPMQYAYRLRLRKAAQLLGESTLAVSEVAARVGFEDPLHFSRQFRKYMGAKSANVPRGARCPRCRESGSRPNRPHKLPYANCMSRCTTSISPDSRSTSHRERSPSRKKRMSTDARPTSMPRSVTSGSHFGSTGDTVSRPFGASASRPRIAWRRCAVLPAAHACGTLAAHTGPGNARGVRAIPA